MYCGDGQNEIKKKIKYIVIICNVFSQYMPNLPRHTENNKIINNLCIVGIATFEFFLKKLNKDKN